MRNSKGVEGYLKSNPNFDISKPSDGAKFSPLRMAAYYDHKDCLRAILEFGIILDPLEIETTFSCVLDQGKCEAIETLLDSGLIDLTKVSPDGNPMGIVFLIKAMQKIENLKNNSFAVNFKADFEKIAIKLIDKNTFQINAKDIQEDTALHKAAFFGNTMIIEKLHSVGADKKVINKYGKTPFDIYKIVQKGKIDYEGFLDPQIVSSLS